MSKLKTHEWGAVVVYVSLLAAITAYTQLYIPWNYPTFKEKPHWLQDPFLDVYVTGAVRHPGPYRVKRGATRGDVLTDADPLQEADLRHIRTSTKLKQGDLLEIPALEMIKITVIGEVKAPKEITVLKGTKVFEIEKEVELLAQGDPGPLRRKRALKDGEIVLIKKKKS